MKKKVKLCAALLLALTTARAQQAPTAAGGNASGSGGSVSYSIGQVVYTTNTGTNGSVAQGVQQPYEISVVTGLAEAQGITLQCEAYPNPATDFVKLKVDNHNTENLIYQLYDISGKLILNEKINSTVTSISMETLADAIYILKVIANKTEIKSFQIIKNK